MQGFTQKLKRFFRAVPWWGVSLVVHLFALYILDHWRLAPQPREEALPPIVITGIRNPELPKPPLDVFPYVPTAPPTVDPLLPREQFAPVLDPPALEAFERSLGGTGTGTSVGDGDGPTAVLGVQGGTRVFSGRTPGGRAAAVGRGGGATPGSESAVELGLMWLASHQASTGGWRAAHEGARWAEPGLTGLATLAFLSAGYTHKTGGRFARIVERALAYLKLQQDREGCIALTEAGRRGGGYMYCHAMAALAIIEAYGMTKDPLLREVAERAVDFICTTQNATGGWRYYYNSPDGDSSVSGWMVMALRSASLSGLVVPPRAFDNARRFFASVTDKAEGKTYYMRVTADAGDGKVGVLPMGLALNAVGLLAHQYLGLPGDDPYIDKAAAVILETPPKWAEKSDSIALPLDRLALFTSTNNYYFWYYANLALHQRHGKAWDQWHPQVRDLLLKIVDREGDKDGSWPPLTYGGSTGGRVYSTAIAILTLEVYYRYAPMYREPVDEVLAAYGDALAAYNHFVRLDQEKKPDAGDARKTAIEKLGRFLALSESKTEAKSPEKTAERRQLAARMLVALHQAGGDLEQAIALLKSFPGRFPGAIESTELVKLLADLYRALAKQLADAGETEKAKRATVAAADLYYPIVAGSLGKNPDLELWLAAVFFEREDWQKAFDLYTARIENVALAKLDPKGVEGKMVVSVYDRLVKCSIALGKYKTASWYLERIEKLLGPSLATHRQRAELCRLRNDYAGALKIYSSILPRVPEFSKDWWETKYEQLFMAYLLGGQAEQVVLSIRTLQLAHPELGGEELLPRFLDLLGRAEGGKPPARVPPGGAG